MVENFTTVNENIYIDKELEPSVDKTFENNLIQGIQNLAKDPNEKTIENILNYSKSIRK